MSTVLTEPIPPETAPLTETLIAALALTAVSDRILFNAPIGLSLVIFALLTGSAALWLHRVIAGKMRLFMAACLYGLALLPLLENISPLSLAVAVSLFAIGSLTIADGLRGALFEKMRQLVLFLLSTPVAAPMGVLGWRRAAKAAGTQIVSFATAGVWLMPVIIGLVFLALFEEANPVIAQWLQRLDFWAIFDLLNPARLLFLTLVFVVTWPFLRPMIRKRKLAKTAGESISSSGGPAFPEKAQTVADVLFGEAAILRALLVFNVMFALQSLLDAAYLFGGMQLPDGMSYASYAHRGAYPLIVTTLMAALFVLLALRSGSAARANGLIRQLVYLWVGQNILLVFSSILRLDLYVDAYGLTYWRVAAFIWMALVACGLGLIVWRIVRNRSAEWLVGTNLGIAATVLYAACFVNFASMIGNYNTAHGIKDYWYLASLGPQAIPAFDKELDAVRAAGCEPVPSGQFGYQCPPVKLADWRSHAMLQVQIGFTDWRGWTLRGWRLSRYLQQHAAAAMPVDIGGRER
jgi:Domain of unknown function (DUF4173)